MIAQNDRLRTSSNVRAPSLDTLPGSLTNNLHISLRFSFSIATVMHQDLTPCRTSPTLFSIDPYSSCLRALSAELTITLRNPVKCQVRDAASGSSIFTSLVTSFPVPFHRFRYTMFTHVIFRRDNVLATGYALLPKPPA